jgi:hypothetical protein
MLEKIIIVDYVEGAGGEYFSQFLNNHLHKSEDVWLQKYFNSESLIIELWDQKFTEYLGNFLSLCYKRAVTEIAIPYHLYKWPQHLALFNQISKNVRAVKINSTKYNHEVTIDFLRKIYLCPVEKTQMSQLSYYIKSATDQQKQQINELLRTNTLQWIDVRILLDNTTKRQLIDKILARNISCPSQDIEINYGTFYVDYNKIDDKYNLLCKQLGITPDNILLTELITRNQTNWATLSQYIEQFPDIYKQL